MITTTCDNCGKQYEGGYSSEDCIQNDKAKFMVHIWPKERPESGYKSFDYCPNCTLRMLREIPLTDDSEWPDDVTDGRKGDGPFIWRG